MTRSTDEPRHPTDARTLAALPIGALAELWIDRAAGSLLGGFDDSLLMGDTNAAILRGGALRVLALIREIVRIETDPDILSYLAATLLEEMLPIGQGPLLEAVEAAIAEDERFADLFFDINFNGLEDAVVERLVSAVRKAVHKQATKGGTT